MSNIIKIESSAKPWWRSRKTILTGVVALVVLIAVVAVIYITQFGILKTETAPENKTSYTQEDLNQISREYNERTEMLKVRLVSVDKSSKEIVAINEQEEQKTYNYTDQTSATKGVSLEKIDLGSLEAGTILYLTYDNRDQQVVAVWVDA